TSPVRSGASRPASGSASASARSRCPDRPPRSARARVVLRRRERDGGHRSPLAIGVRRSRRKEGPPMSKHGPRCVHCGQYHGEGEDVCLWTGKPLPRPDSAPESSPARPVGFETLGNELIGQTVGGKYQIKSV